MFFFSPKIKRIPPPLAVPCQTHGHFLFHERPELLTPSRWSGRPWFFPEEVFQGTQRIGIEASDILPMTCVHWELSKCKVSLRRVLYYKSQGTKAHLQQHNDTQRGFSGEICSWNKSNLGSQDFQRNVSSSLPAANPLVIHGPMVGTGVPYYYSDWLLSREAGMVWWRCWGVVPDTLKNKKARGSVSTCRGRPTGQPGEARFCVHWSYHGAQNKYKKPTTLAAEMDGKWKKG